MLEQDTRAELESWIAREAMAEAVAQTLDFALGNIVERNTDRRLGDLGSLQV